jgi:hypothetical protein
MKKLVDIASLFLGIIVSSLDNVPYGIRWLCSAIKTLAMVRTLYCFFSYKESTYNTTAAKAKKKMYVSCCMPQNNRVGR